MSREDGIASYFMRVSEIRDQLPKCGSDKELTTIVLNALPEESSNFTSSIYGKKEATPFNELWSLCKIKETRLKEKKSMYDQASKLKHLLPWLEEKGNLGSYSIE